MTLILHTQDSKNEGNDFGWTLARVVGQDGLMLQQSDVDSIALFVYDATLQDGAAIYSNAAIDPATVISDTPQRDRLWTLPDEGYNFSHYLTAALAFGTVDELGGHTYQLEYRIETTPRNASGNVFVIRKVRVSPIYSARI